MARSLDGGCELNALAVFYVRIFDGRDAAEAEDGDVDRSGVVFQVEQIGSITGGTSRQLVGIEGRHVPDGTPQYDLLQMKRHRLIQDLAYRDWFSGHSRRETDRPSEPHGDQGHHERIQHRPILQKVMVEVPSAW